MPLQLSYATPLSAVDSIVKECLSIIDKNINKNPQEQYIILKKELKKPEFKQLVEKVVDGAFYVRIDDKGHLQNDKFLLQKKVNLLIDEVLKENRGEYEIDYYSPSMFTKVGNNNLEIKENLQSAALLYTL